MRVRSILRQQPVGSRLDDPEALRAAYDAHGSELYRLAVRQLGDDGLPRTSYRRSSCGPGARRRRSIPRWPACGSGCTRSATGFSTGVRYTVEVMSADGTHPGAGAFIGVGERSRRCNLNSPVLRSDATGFRVLDDTGAVVVASSF